MLDVSGISLVNLAREITMHILDNETSTASTVRIHPSPTEIEGIREGIKHDIDAIMDKYGYPEVFKALSEEGIRRPIGSSLSREWRLVIGLAHCNDSSIKFRRRLLGS